MTTDTANDNKRLRSEVRVLRDENTRLRLAMSWVCAILEQALDKSTEEAMEAAGVTQTPDDELGFD